MKNIDWIKREWIKKIEEMDSNEIYEILSDGTVEIKGGLCALCKKEFEPCEMTEEDDSICKQRFALWCEKEREYCERIIWKR